MIREDLLDLQYYLDRLSMFMRESYGIDEQVETFFSLLKQANDYLDEFFRQMDFFHVNPEGEMLDKIAKIFGCERDFTIAVIDPSDITVIDSYEQVSLTDQELLSYIKAQVIKQNFDGSRETLQKLYSSWKDGVMTKGILDLRFLYTTEEDEDGAICTIRWDTENPSRNMRLLFENGYLTIESVGILYRRSIVNFNNLGHYAIEKLTLLAEEPDDWDTAAGKYFSVVLSGHEQTWDWTHTYVKMDGSGAYIVQATKPMDWDEEWETYYITTITEKAAGAQFGPGYYETNMSSSNRYALNSVGGVYA